MKSSILFLNCLEWICYLPLVLRQKIPLINVFLKFDGNLSFEDLKNLVQNKINESEIPGGSNAFKKFKQTLQSYCGYFVWKDIDNFDINNHIKKINLSELYPGEAQNINKTNSLLQNSCAEILTCKYLSEYGSRPFPDNLPQWEVLILSQEGSRILLHIWCIALFPYVILLMFQGRKNPLHGADLHEKKIYVTSKDIPFDIVKSIKKGTKASATDILFSCLSFSLASFFQTRAVEVSDITMFFPIGEYDPTTPVLSQMFTWSERKLKKFDFGFLTIPQMEQVLLLFPTKDNFVCLLNVDTALISKQEEAEKLLEGFIFALESLQKEVNEKNY
ncbi:hypothetical protein Anas_04386 [Armadillidium nasatum]|uniref:O-acyltransferase WSD1 C-terminal domain-containing protein n=1 Tax=Armadillidium nasatum TaxID=96803 RepID=A0A5N5TNP7_9CRUS|nr:hypothetical protein Anas_04386 [Armadillidium nasatum]